MTKTISIQDMRYLNLFSRITRIDTRFCFHYNETIIFCVPRSLVSKAIGERGINVKKLNEITGRRIKVIAVPNSSTGIYDIKKFIESVVSPLTFRDLSVDENEIVITAGAHSKAALIGRNKRRLIELNQISKDYFSREVKIV